MYTCMCIEFWIILYVVITQSTVAGYDSMELYFKEDSRYQNSDVQNYILWSNKNKSTIYCAGRCMSDTKCLSFSINELSNECKGYSLKLPDSLTTVSNFGTKYYVLSEPSFVNGKVRCLLDSVDIYSASGMAASKLHQDVLYTHNDNGDGPNLYAFQSSDCNLIATLTVSGAENRDWEDIATGPCPDGGHCIYIGDTGRSGNTIYRVREPALIEDQSIPLDDILKFIWNKGTCEAIMVDPKSNLYIVSDEEAKIGLIPSYAWDQSDDYLILNISTVNMPPPKLEITAGDISPDGREILLQVENEIFYWYSRASNYLEVVQTVPTTIPFTYVPDTQSVCWDRYGHGYYATSQMPNSDLYYYEKL